MYYTVHNTPLTPNADFADSVSSNRGTVATTFKFTAYNDVVNGSTATLAGPDILIDSSNTDNDTMNISVNGNTALGTVNNVETINLNVGAGTAGGTVTYTALTGLKTLNLTGSATAATDLSNGGAVTNLANTGVTTINAAGMTTGGITVNSSTSASTATLTVTGSDAADTITLGLGADTVNAGKGNDSVVSGAGADTVNGGDGNDFLSGQNDNDTLNGDAGVDNIDGGAGNDTINGGSGNDLIVTSGGNDTVTGGTGNDAIALGTAGTAMTATSANLAALGVITAAGNNTVVFGADLATNGVDNISGFNVGTVDAATGGDVLNVSAFLGKAVTGYAEVLVTGANNVAGSNVVVVTNGTLANKITAGLVLSASSNIVIVEVDGTTNTTANVHYVTTDSNAAIVGNDIVATIIGQTAGDISGFVAANFA